MSATPVPLPPAYHTEEGRSSALGRRLPNLVFYTGMLREVFIASARARLGSFDDASWIKRSRRITGLVEAAGGTLSIGGLDIVAGLTGPAVFIGNHMSTLETFVLPCLICPHRPVTYIVKDSLVRYPVFGAVMRSRDPVVVGRQNPREDLKTVLEEGAARLGRGVSIVVFPQTTRTDRLDPEQFNSIGIKLARRAGVPVVPVAARTSFWGTGRLLKDFGAIHPEIPVNIAFGQPLAISGTGRDEHEAVIRFISGKLDEWGREGLNS